MKSDLVIIELNKRLSTSSVLGLESRRGYDTIFELEVV